MRQNQAGPSLSVLMANYNHGHFIGAALRSVLRQSRQPDELIVIDDASQDDSVEVVERLLPQRPGIKFLRSEVNRGIAHWGHYGVEHARGDYIYFAAADDIVLPGYFARAMEWLGRFPAAGLCSGVIGWIDEADNHLGYADNKVVSWRPGYFDPRRCRGLVRRHDLWIAAPVCRRSCLAEFGGFRPELSSYADAFIHVLSALKYGACYLPTPVALRRLAADSYSAVHNKDPRRWLEIVQRATALIREQYADLYPRGYAEVWEEETLMNHRTLAEALAHQRALSPRRRCGLWPATPDPRPLPDEPPTPAKGLGRLLAAVRLMAVKGSIYRHKGFLAAICTKRIMQRVMQGRLTIARLFWRG